jgi:hypothetical protein
MVRRTWGCRDFTHSLLANEERKKQIEGREIESLVDKETRLVNDYGSNCDDERRIPLTYTTINFLSLHNGLVVLPL